MNSSETSKITISERGQRIYLASPYTHKDKIIMSIRYKAAVKTTAELINEGALVFSPIVHCHPIAVAHILPRDYTFWQDYSTSFLTHWAEAIYVLCLEGWKDSIGIDAELDVAKNLGLSIHFINLA